MSEEKLIKTISEWPLSKVDLVEIDENIFIRKTIHKDFKNEYFRQKFLHESLRWTKVPKLYELTEQGSKVSFLMNYVDTDREVTEREALELLNDFHNQTFDLRDSSFNIYDLNSLKSDLITASKYSVDLKIDNFNEIFNHQKCILHGDFGTDQMLIDKQNQLYIIDFGKSYIAPAILDIAYFCRNNDKRQHEAMKLFGYKEDQMNQASIVVALMQITWFDLCRNMYVKDHDYINNEIKSEVEKINELNS